MDELFVFCMYATFCVLFFTISLALFYILLLISLFVLKRMHRIFMTHRDGRLFVNIDDVTKEMRDEMVYVMEDRAEKQLDHLNLNKKKLRIDRTRARKLYEKAVDHE